MFCNECGHALNENGVCPICGWQVSQNNQPASGQQIPYNNGSVYGGQPMSYGYGQPTPYNPPQYNGQPNPYQNMQGNVPPAAPPKTVKKKRWPLIAGISGCVVVLAVGIALIATKRPVKDLTQTTAAVTTEQQTSFPTTESVTTEQQPVSSGSKTVMIYMVGSDLESDHLAASTDIDEMLDSGFDESAMNVLLYTGGCRDWHNSSIPENANTIFKIENGNLKELTSKDASNMGDPANLTEFLNYGYSNYPAEQYDLILWNHGGGAFFGYGYDETTSDSLTLDELQQAFTDSPFHDENKLNLIGFDACLMANIETAHALSSYANYMVASQEPEPGCGWHYSFLDDIDTIQDGTQIGQAIVDSYIQETTDYMNSFPFSYTPVCLSVLDLSQVGACETALNDLFAVVNDNFDESTYARYSAIRTSAKEIAASYSYTEGSYDVVDLTDYTMRMQSLHPAESTALSNALGSLIVYSSANEKRINGVSIYHPYYTKEYVSSLIPMYTTFDFADNYTSYISRFAGMLTDTDAFTVTWNPEELVPVMNEDSTFSVDLNSEQSAALQNAYFVIAKKDHEQDGMYDLVALSSAVSDDGTGKMTADFDGQITYMQNDTTKENYELMYTVQEKTDTYTRYLLSSILYNDDIEGDDSMYAYFVLEVSDEHPEGQILGAYPIDNYINTEGNEIFPERYEINIDDYQNVAFGYFSHRFTSNEDLTNFNEADWADLMINYSSFPISEGFTPVRDALLAGEEYYGMFIFEDMQGNRHCSSLVQIQ